MAPPSSFSFSAPDGTELAYRVRGEGSPLVALPGGPTDSAYLGDLGGLSRYRRLIMPDLRGTGGSATPRDPASYRCDRMVADVEALRAHLGLDRMDLLAHCAGANLAVLYASCRPERVERLTLVTPSVAAVGLTISGELRLETVRARAAEPWFPAAYAALEAITQGRATAASWEAITPFSYGRWDETARAHQAAADERSNPEVMAAYGAEGAYDPPATRAALARLTAPVRLLAGEVDPGAPPATVAAYAALFPEAELVIQPGAGHFPWLDDPDRFVVSVCPQEFNPADAFNASPFSGD
ncbi:alpha/beta fold hydrolase [Streptomyces griseofuscus]|uniref:alpha/beta fold hydrolase n=1 Tax=Streptomyces griseofuscus TaxID=146922 RepID=UPI003409CA90